MARRKKQELSKLKNGLKETNIVQKSKPLFSLWKSDLTLSEFKILDTYLSRIDSHKPEQRSIIFEKGKLEELLGVKKINKQNLDNRLKHLQGTIVNIGDDKHIDRITLFERAQGEIDEYGIWKVTLTCTPSAMKYIFNIEDIGYLRYKIKSIINISSLYSYILFTYLEYNRFRKSWEEELDELKILINCNNELYNDFKYFNQRILKKCQQELQEKTELRYSYEPIKAGRKVVKIKFTLETLSDIILDNKSVNTYEVPPQIPFDEQMNDDKVIEEYIVELRKICNEFSDEQIKLLYKLVSEFVHQKGIIDYFDMTMYKLNFYNQQKEKNNEKPIKNKFGYVKKIIQSEYKEYLEKEKELKYKTNYDQKETSYDLKEYEEWTDSDEYLDYIIEKNK